MRKQNGDTRDALRYVTAGLKSAPKNWILARLYAILMTDLGYAEQARGAWQIVARYTPDDRFREIAERAIQSTSSLPTK